MVLPLVVKIAIFSITKKVTLFMVAKAYGFPRLYRRLLELNNRVFARNSPSHQRAKYLIEGSFRLPSRALARFRRSPTRGGGSARSASTLAALPLRYSSALRQPHIVRVRGLRRYTVLSNPGLFVRWASAPVAALHACPAARQRVLFAAWAAARTPAALDTHGRVVAVVDDPEKRPLSDQLALLHSQARVRGLTLLSGSSLRAPGSAVVRPALGARPVSGRSPARPGVLCGAGAVGRVGAGSSPLSAAGAGAGLLSVVSLACDMTPK